MNDTFCAKTKGAMANCKAARRENGFIAEWEPQRENRHYQKIVRSWL
jgi:hypothetical protein